MSDLDQPQHGPQHTRDVEAEVRASLARTASSINDTHLSHPASLTHRRASRSVPRVWLGAAAAGIVVVGGFVGAYALRTGGAESTAPATIADAGSSSASTAAGLDGSSTVPSCTGSHLTFVKQVQSGVGGLAGAGSTSESSIRAAVARFTVISSCRFTDTTVTLESGESVKGVDVPLSVGQTANGTLRGGTALDLTLTWDATPGVAPVTQFVRAGGAGGTLTLEEFGGTVRSAQVAVP